MNKIAERKKEGGAIDKNTFISFIIKIDRFSGMNFIVTTTLKNKIEPSNTKTN